MFSYWKNSIVYNALVYYAVCTEPVTELNTYSSVVLCLAGKIKQTVLYYDIKTLIFSKSSIFNYYNAMHLYIHSAKSVPDAFKTTSNYLFIIWGLWFYLLLIATIVVWF